MLDAVEEVAAGEVLEDEKVLVAILDGLEELHDARVLQHPQHLHLGNHLALCVLLGGAKLRILEVHDLDGAAAPAGHLRASPYAREAAAAERLGERVRLLEGSCSHIVGHCWGLRLAGWRGCCCCDWGRTGGGACRRLRLRLRGRRRLRRLLKLHIIIRKEARLAIQHANVPAIVLLILSQHLDYIVPLEGELVRGSRLVIIDGARGALRLIHRDATRRAASVSPDLDARCLLYRLLLPCWGERHVTCQ